MGQRQGESTAIMAVKAYEHIASVSTQNSSSLAIYITHTGIQVIEMGAYGSTLLAAVSIMAR